VKIVRKLGPYVDPRLMSQPCCGRNTNKRKGFKADTWRDRISGFRLFYEIDDGKKIVLMIAADARQRSFKETG